MWGRRVICTRFTTLSKVGNNSVALESTVCDYDVCVRVCLCVCVCMQTVSAKLMLCMYMLETHIYKYTNTYICFLIGPSGWCREISYFPLFDYRLETKDITLKVYKITIYALQLQLNWIESFALLDEIPL